MSAKSLGARAATSAAYVGGAQFVKLGLNVLSTIVVARLLTPSDYGVIAMIAPITAFLFMFQDLGLSQAAIQARTLTQAHGSSLFWLNIGASAAITVALLAAAPLIGLFYHDGRTSAVAAAWGLIIMVAGTGLQHSALLNRDMRFGALALIDIISAIMAFVATATAAVVLRSYWALWIGSLTGVVVSVVLFWKSSGWRPNTRPSFRGAGEMVRFGGKVSVANMVNFLIRNADNVLIGRVSGPAQLGLYDRSYKLMMLPLVNISGPLGQVMLPALGRLRDDGEAYRRAFLTAVRTLQLVLVPGAAVAAATSDRMIPFLLGPRWSAASDIFFWLSLTGLIQPLPNTMGWLFITSGRVGEQLRWNIFSAAVTLAGFAVGIRYGAVGVAASLFFTAAVRVPILFWYAGIGTSVRAYDLYRSMREPYLAGAAAFYLAHKLSPYLPTGPLLLAGLLAGYVLAILLFLATRDGRSLLKTIIRLCASGLRGFARGADR